METDDMMRLLWICLIAMKSQVGAYVLLKRWKYPKFQIFKLPRKPVSVSLCLHHSYVSINADSRCCNGMQVLMEGMQAV